MTHASSLLKTVLTAMVGVAGELEGAKIGLIENADPITPGTLLANVQQAQYDGYALSSAVTWGAVHNDVGGNARVFSSTKEFIPTGGTTSSEVTQVILVNGAGDTILSSYVLPEPITFLHEDSVHSVGFPFVLGQSNAETPNIEP